MNCTQELPKLPTRKKIPGRIPELVSKLANISLQHPRNVCVQCVCLRFALLIERIYVLFSGVGWQYYSIATKRRRGRACVGMLGFFVGFQHADCLVTKSRPNFLSSVWARCRLAYPIYTPRMLEVFFLAPSLLLKPSPAKNRHIALSQRCRDARSMA